MPPGPYGSRQASAPPSADASPPSEADVLRSKAAGAPLRSTAVGEGSAEVLEGAPHEPAETLYRKGGKPIPASVVDAIYIANPPPPPRAPMDAAAAAAGAPPGNAGRRWDINVHHPYYDSDGTTLGYWVHSSRMNTGLPIAKPFDTRREWHQLPMDSYQVRFGRGEYGKSGKQREDTGYAPYKGSGKGARPPAGRHGYDWPPPPAPPPSTQKGKDKGRSSSKGKDSAKGSSKGKASSSKGSSTARYESDEDYYARGAEILNQMADADRGWEPPSKGKSKGKSKGSSSWQQYRGWQTGGW